LNKKKETKEKKNKGKRRLRDLNLPPLDHVESEGYITLKIIMVLCLGLTHKRVVDAPARFEPPTS
jgi:hypothetical protein